MTLSTVGRQIESNPQREENPCSRPQRRRETVFQAVMLLPYSDGTQPASHPLSFRAPSITREREEKILETRKGFTNSSLRLARLGEHASGNIWWRFAILALKMKVGVLCTKRSSRGLSFPSTQQQQEVGVHILPPHHSIANKCACLSQKKGAKRSGTII